MKLLGKSMIKKLYNKYKFLRNTCVENGDIVLSSDSKFKICNSAQIIIKKGLFSFGRGTNVNLNLPSYNKTVLSMGENSKLIIDGDVFIFPGTYLQIGDNATMVFKGRNYISSNCIFICNNHFEFGERASLSWHVSIIDNDGHKYYSQENKELGKKNKKMIIGQNVGIHMNVAIPSAVTIGDNSIIGANTVVRRDIPSDSLVYQNPELKIKAGVTTGFQFDR